MPLPGVNDERSKAEYLGGIIKRVGNYRPEKFEQSFDHRKRFQKTVYLIQAFDISLGYEFTWYLQGVYCPKLADIGYELAEVYNDVPPTKFKDREKESRFHQFLEFIDDIKYDVTALEASSSLHYVQVRNPEADKDMVIGYVCSEKDLGDSPNKLCEQEWERLANYGAL